MRWILLHVFIQQLFLEHLLPARVFQALVKVVNKINHCLGTPSEDSGSESSGHLDMWSRGQKHISKITVKAFLNQLAVTVSKLSLL